MEEEKTNVETSSVTPEENTVVPEETSIPNTTTTETSIPSDNNFAPTPDASVPPKKSSPVVPIVIVVVLLALIGGGVFYFLNSAKDGKTIIETAINDTFNMAISNLDEVKKKAFSIKEDDVVSLMGDINISTTYPGFDELKEYNYKVDVRVDQKNNQMSMMAGIDRNSAEMIAFDAFIKDNKMYLKSDKIFNGIFYTDVEDFNLNADNLELATTDDYVQILTTIKKGIVNGINEEKITTESVKRKVDGKEGTYLKTTYALDEKGYLAFSKSVINAVKEDKDTLKVLARLSLMTEEELIEDLDSALEDIDPESATSTDVVNINLYTNKVGKLVGLDIIYEEKTVIDVVKNGEKFEYTVYNSEQVKMVEGTIDEAKGLIDGTIMPDTYAIKFKFSNKDNKTELDVSGEFEGTKLSLNITSDVKDSKTKMEGKTIAEVKLEVKGEEISAKVDADVVVTTDEKVKTFDVTNARDMNTMTLQEEEEMARKLQETFNGTIFMTMYETFFSAMSNQIQTSVNQSVYCSQAYDCIDMNDGTSYCKYQYGPADYEYDYITCPTIPTTN